MLVDNCELLEVATAAQVERLGDLAVLDRLVLEVVLLGIPVGPAAVNDKLLGREAVGGVAALSSFPSIVPPSLGYADTRTTAAGTSRRFEDGIAKSQGPPLVGKVFPNY